MKIILLLLLAQLSVHSVLSSCGCRKPKVKAATAAYAFKEKLIVFKYFRLMLVMSLLKVVSRRPAPREDGEQSGDHLLPGKS